MSIGSQPEVTIAMNRLDGLTKREYFAALAMQGLLVAGMGARKTIPYQEEVAELAVMNADALIKELEKN